MPLVEPVTIADLPCKLFVAIAVAGAVWVNCIAGVLSIKKNGPAGQGNLLPGPMIDGVMGKGWPSASFGFG
jgi:hypothetical protein